MNIETFRFSLEKIFFLLQFTIFFSLILFKVLLFALLLSTYFDDDDDDEKYIYEGKTKKIQLKAIIVFSHLK
jgi:hypothetical protein